MLDAAGFVAGLTGDPPPGPLTPGSASARPNSSESRALRAALPPGPEPGEPGAEM